MEEPPLWRAGLPQIWEPVREHGSAGVCDEPPHGEAASGLDTMRAWAETRGGSGAG